MNMTAMHLADPTCRRIANETEILDELLHLKNASILELGCGKAEKTHIVAQQAASFCLAAASTSRSPMAD